MVKRELVQSVIDAVRLVDIGTAIACVGECASRNPGPWASPHISALQNLSKALDRLEAEHLDPQGKE